MPTVYVDRALTFLTATVRQLGVLPAGDYSKTRPLKPSVIPAFNYEDLLGHLITAGSEVAVVIEGRNHRSTNKLTSFCIMHTLGDFEYKPQVSFIINLDISRPVTLRGRIVLLTLKLSLNYPCSEHNTSRIRNSHINNFDEGSELVLK